MSTGIGIVSGFALLLTAIFMGGGIGVFLNPEAVMITVGGTIAATLISYPLDRLFKFFKLVVQLFKEERQTVFEQTISRLVMLGQKASQDTIFSLEKEAKHENNRYLKAGLQLLVQDAPASRIARAICNRTGRCQKQASGGNTTVWLHVQNCSLPRLGRHPHRHDQHAPRNGRRCQPRNARSQYGCCPRMHALRVSTGIPALPPASEKLKAYSIQEQTLIQMICEALMLIREGQTGREMEEILNAYLPPQKRHAVLSKDFF